ncbi:XVIPCD domain-containing protein [Stenotrophomonas sp. NPDC077659]|uniref:XVIPCD domain-containing protein n=1 Tax=Stenotrophomonas sp. NPDC077659 TaxID=3390694 RepID=UPI003CFD979F
MSGLSQKNLEILGHYARSGYRELYWNYLSQLEGADGYGTLALGVVRNDSLPGRVANSYAQSHASHQHDNGSRHPNANLSEREWESFGQTLIVQDLERRQRWFDLKRPDLALNLPGRDVMLSHDRAFEHHRLDPNCWTPRVLLQAALAKEGPQKMEQIWAGMLNNDYRGMTRAWDTSTDAVTQMGAWRGTSYVLTLTAHEAVQALEGRSSVDPNVIGGNSHYAMYFEGEKKWASVSAGGGHVTMSGITGPARIAELNDAREVRLERQHKATQFHSDDTFRTITPSPKTASINDRPDAHAAPTRLADIGPGHSEYAMLQQVRQGVSNIDAQMGRTPDEISERLTAAVLALARQNNLQSADHVVLSAQTQNAPAGRDVFVVQGGLDGPPHLRASMPTDIAVRTPVEQSLQSLHAAGEGHDQMQAQGKQQAVDPQMRESAAIRMA